MSRIGLCLVVMFQFAISIPAEATECAASGTVPTTAPDDFGQGTATACGDQAKAQGNASLAIGYGTDAAGNSSSAVGYIAKAIADQSQAFGYSAESSGIRSMAAGYNATSAATDAIAIGPQSLADAGESMAIGYTAEAGAVGASAFGPYTFAFGPRSTAIGHRAFSEQADAIVLGSIPGILSATAYAKVGIGTATPDEAVDVERSAAAARFQLTSFTATPEEAPQYIQRRARGTRITPTAVQNNDNLGLFSFRGYNGTAMGGSRATITAQAAGNFTGASTPTRLIFATTPVGQTVPQQVLVITPDGKVQVNGQNLTVPDYVFEDDYELMPLDELKTFIDKNGHLPGIPSADDVNAGTHDLAGSDMAHLRKIEELTLYTLQQEGRLAEQESQLQAQRGHLEAQQERIDRLETLLNQALARID